MTSSKKMAFYLPNIFTALNMACGFTSMILASRSQIYEASLILILGAIFDSVDGRVARLMGTSSAFGEQFDSLSDIVSFGVAPSYLIYQKYLYQYGRLGAVISFLYLLCAALRLARFNANIEKIRSDFFQGLPSPGAALGLIGLVLLSVKYPLIDEYAAGAIFYTVTYAVLMITTIPFYSFKNSELVKKNKRTILIVFFFLAALIVIYYKIMFFVGMAIYVLISIIYYFTKVKEFGDAFNWNEEA